MLLRWAEGFGPVRCAGVEGTSSYGAGLTRHLRASGIEVLEVERPKHRRRSSRSNLEKSDPSDAERAARAVLAGEKRRACPRAPTVAWRWFGC
jgi:transposase